MHKEQIVAIAVRLFAIFLFVYLLREVGNFMQLVTDETYRGGVLLPIIMVFLIALMAVYSWFFPLTIASKIIPQVDSSVPLQNIGNNEIEFIAFSVLGVWVLASALPDTFYWVTLVYMFKTSGMGLASMKPEYMGNIIATIIQLGIGIWLLLGSKGIIKVLRRVRYAGNKNAF